MSYQLYQSDLTDREWEYIKRLIPAAKSGGRKRQTDMRLTVNAIFYINRAGGQWRYLPREYPPWQTVYGYFRVWRIAGIWERIHDHLRDLSMRLLFCTRTYYHEQSDFLTALELHEIVIRHLSLQNLPLEYAIWDPAWLRVEGF